ncbi:MAG: pyridoxamine 5'-phosphate oxidase family protein [Tepidisphaeraceae bacterium]
MAAVQPCITPELAEFILAQPLFFVGTAPLSRTGHINLSPKGLGTFRVLSQSRVAYLDLTGSGNETAAHVLENGRITFLFCAFEEPPKILRLYGTGRTVREDEAEWPEMIGLFPEMPGARQIVVADISRVQTSCGFGVPMMKVVGQRETLVKWAQRKGPAGMAEYRARKNAVSIDGMSAYGPREVGAAKGRDI